MNGITAFVRQQIATVEHALDADQQARAADRRRSSRRQNPRWTAEEDATLRRAYAAGGRHAAKRALSHRSPGAVDNRANKLGLRGTPHISLGRLEWRLACAQERVREIEEEIRRRSQRSA